MQCHVFSPYIFTFKLFSRSATFKMKKKKEKREKTKLQVRNKQTIENKGGTITHKFYWLTVFEKLFWELQKTSMKKINMVWWKRGN